MPTKHVYVQGDPDKTPVDPTKQVDGTMLVRVTDSGYEFPYMAQTGLKEISNVPETVPEVVAPVTEEPLPKPLSASKKKKFSQSSPK